MVSIKIGSNFIPQKYFDLILIKNKGVDYFQIYKEKTNIKINKIHKVNTEIYENGILKLTNLEAALTSIIENFKIKELGIIIDLPNIIFQKISIPKTSVVKESILNYLKTNFPLPIENYAISYQEDGFKPIGSLSNFSIFLIEKDLIERILFTTKSLGLMPLFITLQSEILLQYLIKNSLIEFNEDYLIFFVSKNNLLTFLINNFTIQKLIVEDYKPEKIDISSMILRIYNFLKKYLKDKTKIFIIANFEKEDLKLNNINQFVTFFKLSPEKIVVEGGHSILNYIFQDKEIIDFSPLKNYYTYFVNRLPSISKFLNIYFLILSIFISLFFLPFYFKFNKQIVVLKEKNKNLTNNISNLENPELLFKLKEELNKGAFAKIFEIKDIINIEGFENLTFQNENLIFSFKIKKDEAESFKYQINQKFPQAEIIEENLIDNEVNLKYKF